MQLDRRGFIGAAGIGLVSTPLGRVDAAMPAPTIPDEGWKLWIDRDARYREDRIYLPSQVDLARLPVNPPSGGWDVLDHVPALTVTLPTTVEQHLWGAFGERPFTADEYRYGGEDVVPQNGAYRGVSWWYRAIDIPARLRGRRVLLTLRGARMRAEVYLNRQLVGYSIMSELPITCDLTAAMRPGAANQLAIRITNPGGRFDWRDSTTTEWGGVKLYLSHGFGGLDRGMMLTDHPIAGHIADAWVLNTPDPRRVTAHAELWLRDPPYDAEAIHNSARVTLLDPDGAPMFTEARFEAVKVEGSRVTVRFAVHAPAARLWDLADPVLHDIRFDWGGDTRTVRFGFRWFAPDGFGSDAVLRLNGRRVRLYSAISWGYWGYNGVWPTPALARREVAAAKALGLNCLHFHRNVGKTEVLDVQDEQGLLRVMEPGGGRFAISKGGALSAADRFSRDFLVEKCVAMARTFRSHPSLVHYTLQNELGADLANPDVQAVLRAIHDTDPSRTVILNDGFVQRGAAQAMYLPYDDTYHRSDKEPWGGWWDNHQGAGDQWYDKFYVSKDDYVHRQTGKPFIVEFGEMEGCAVADNHPAMLADIAKAAHGRSYDAGDHRAILAGTEAFLDRWNFRRAFPTAESLFLSIGRKCYESWQNYLENIRLGESVDVACISGWESTAIDNHSGIVDVLRGFKGDPRVVRASLLPVRPVAKQRRLTYAAGESAELDLYLFNDTPLPATGTLTLTLTLVDPDGIPREIGRYPAPTQTPDRFAYLLAERVATPPLVKPGAHIVRFALSGHADADFARTLWVVDPAPRLPRPARIAVAGVSRSLRARLVAVPGVTVEDFVAGERYDGIVAQGLAADEIARRQIGEQTGLEAQPTKGTPLKLVPGALAADVLAAVRAGTPLVALVPEDGLAEGVATQLAGLGLFRFDGMVGTLRAPWMGNWNYLRAHPLFAGIPADTAAGLLHQIEAQPSNGLIVEGDGIEVIAGYSRDHDRRNGAASFIAKRGAMRVLVHRLPDMVAPLQQRFLANAVAWLAKA
jgi:hypothetical protein